jgi:hypothetical protein
MGSGQSPPEHGFARIGLMLRLEPRFAQCTTSQRFVMKNAGRLNRSTSAAPLASYQLKTCATRSNFSG